MNTKVIRLLVCLVVSVLSCQCDAKFIYWADQSNGTDGIFRASLDGPLPTTDIEQIVFDVRTRLLAVDSLNRKFYWGDGLEIWRSELDGSGASVFINHTGALAIAVDPDNGHFYWADQTFLHRVNLDGTGDTIKALIDESPHGIVIDPINEFIYWSEITTITKQAIHNCPSIDCTAERIVQTGGTGRGLGIDVADDAIFWHGGGGNKIFRTGLDGGEPVMVIDNLLPRVTDLAVDPTQNVLYWSPSVGNIMRTNYSGTINEPAVLLTDPDDDPKALAIFIPEPATALLLVAACMCLMANFLPFRMRSSFADRCYRCLSSGIS